MTVQPEEKETFNLAEYIWLVRQGKWIILAFVVASLGASIFVTLRTRPVYQSSATFIYGLSNMVSQTLDLPSVFWFEVDALKNNQIQIIRSRSMAEAVADSVLRSPDSDSLISVLFDRAVPPPRNLRDALVGLVAGNISVSVLKDSDFFVLSATGSSPSASAVLANLVVHTFYRRNLEEARGESREVRQFLENQLAAVEAELQQAEIDLEEYKTAQGLVDLSTEARDLVSTLVSLETGATEAATNAGALEARGAYLAARAGEFSEGLAEDIQNLNSAFVNSLQNDLAALESARAALIADGIAEDDGALVSIDSQIEARRAALSEALEGLALSAFPDNPTAALQNIMVELVDTEASIRAERTREAELLSRAGEIEARLSRLPAAEMNLARLERNRTVSENVYILLRTKFEETRIAEAGQIGNVTIVDTALPGAMILPSKQKNLIMGLLVGLALGIGVVLLRERLDTSLSSPEHVEALGISILSVIPRMRKPAGKPRSRSEGVSGSVVTLVSPRDPVSEAYRDLRTGLRYSRAGKPLKSVLVTSAGPREGKSTTSSNLAVAFAQAGQKCLLVDADLRRPVAHSLFAVPREPGLSEVVAGLSDIDSCIRKTRIEGLDLLPCGFIPHNPSELLGSGRMSELLSELEGRYDMIIVDSPPVAVVTDALVLSAEVDGVLLVVGAKLGNKKVVQTALSKLSRAAGYVTGAVLNGFDPLRMYTSYGYYTYRYYYYYSEGDRRKSGRRRRSDRGSPESTS